MMRTAKKCCAHFKFIIFPPIHFKILCYTIPKTNVCSAGGNVQQQLCMIERDKKELENRMVVNLKYEEK